MNAKPLRHALPASPAAAGFGLIELMIGVLIGSLLLLGLTQVFSTSRNAYQTSEGLARVQENSRFAMDFLQRDLRMAGHQGCASDVSHFPPNNGTVEFFSHFLTPAQRGANNWAAAPWGLRFNTALEGFEHANSAPGSTLDISGNANPVPFGLSGNWSPALPAELTSLNSSPNPGVVVGSDVVVIRTFDSNSIPVTNINTDVTPAVVTVPLQYVSRVLAGNLYGLADCTKASVFQATTSASPVSGTFTVDVTGLNKSGFNGAGFMPDSYKAQQLQLYPLRSVAYYIGRGTNGGPALMRLNFSGGCTTTCVPEELVDGIENLQFMYGYDNQGTFPDGGIDQYWTAQQVNNLGAAQQGSTDAAWRRIGAVRFAFISRSNDAAAVDRSVAVTVGNTKVLGVNVKTPNLAAGSQDNRLRLPYTSTVAIRNQLYGQ